MRANNWLSACQAVKAAAWLIHWLPIYIFRWTTLKIVRNSANLHQVNSNWKRSDISLHAEYNTQLVMNFSACSTPNFTQMFCREHTYTCISDVHYSIYSVITSTYRCTYAILSGLSDDAYLHVWFYRRPQHDNVNPNNLSQIHDECVFATFPQLTGKPL